MRSLLLAAGLVFALFGSFARSEDFRVESTVFENKEKKPTVQTSTLFYAGVVYDYMDGGTSTAVLDRTRGRFILLDAKKQEKVEIKLEETVAAVKEMGLLASKTNNAFLKFAAEPNFEVHEIENGLEFRASPMTYRVQCVEAPAAIVSQYREFADCTSRMNAFMHPSPPPFPRLFVNAELASRSLMPESIEMTIPKQIALGGKGRTARSLHVLTRQLLQKDFDQIEKTASQMAKYKLVPFAEYRKNHALASK